VRRLVFFLFSVLLLAGVAAGQSDFSVILLPDTQNYSQFYPDTFKAQTNWIVANRAALNIQFVIGLGDIVNTAEDTTQWQNADAAIKILDAAGVPYALAIGNHDYDNESPGSRQATMFNQYFGPSRYAAYTYYKEQYPTGSNENFYTTFTASGKNYLVLVLEMHPRDAALQWASSVVSSHPDYDVIVVTHSFMFVDGTRVDRCDTHDVSPQNGNTPEMMWEKWVSQQKNVIMVVSGHITKKVASRRTDMTSNGNIINQMLSNYQDWPNGGNGYLRILKFHPSTNKVDVQSYSPTLNNFLTDTDNQFTIDLHNPGSPGTGTGAVGGKVRDTSTCTALAGATVSVAGKSATTDANGNFSISLPAPSLYSITADTNGYQSDSEDRQVYEGYSTEADFYLAASSSTTSCPAGSTVPSVHICSPTDGSTVTSPVHVLATARSSTTINLSQIYIDGTAVWTGSGGNVDTNLPLSTGTHRLTVQSKDAAGTVFKSTVFITVSSSTSSGGGCTASSVSPSVTICSPTDGSTVNSPVHVVATSTSSTAVSFMQIYVDGTKVWQNAGGQLDTSVSISAGTHRVTVQAKNAAGQVFKSTVFITVSSSASGGTGCTASSVSPSVTICSPANGATVSSPVHVVATSTSSTAVSYMQIYLDGAKVWQNAGGQLDTSVSMSTGTHRLTVQAKNAAGQIFKSTVNITVSTTTASACTLSTVDPSVTICSPADASTSASPVQIVAGTTSSSPVSYMQIYIDGTKQYQVSADKIDTHLAMSSGEHRVAVQAKNEDDVLFKDVVYVTVQ